MFSLKPKKSGQHPKEQKQKKEKPQSKKIAKTVFEDPFRYRIEVLPSDDSQQVQALLVKYFAQLRSALPYKAPRQGRESVIKFNANKDIKQKLTPLTSKDVVIGIKKTKAILYRSYLAMKSQEQSNLKNSKFIIIFYEEKKYQLLEQLLCLIKLLNIPHIVMRESQQINRSLGVRTVGSLCLMNQQFAGCLIKYVGMSVIDIPWLIRLSVDQI